MFGRLLITSLLKLLFGNTEVHNPDYLLNTNIFVNKCEAQNSFHYSLMVYWFPWTSGVEMLFTNCKFPAVAESKLHNG